ncbi:LOW QUALITY PROTEIN: calpain-2 catalytic subunit-like [Pristis pectinata]|uniref:LOW QUALITY PROTEIN: calpain-2 catalytic subunit-like n=1 Tax=Pristis pectinata TaxID=685728 RepID=UPI00223CA38C|nr:LOW QUALITY PROTEIN: calpain-2 catalytic subunit-like [Pristis pectinata]
METLRDPAEREGSRRNPRPFRRQQHRALAASCLRSGCLFEDPLFPAAGSSLGNVKERVAFWRRPHEILRNPQFFVKGVSRFDVCQGNVGDCWFLAALASLTMQQELFDHVVPPDQDFHRNYCGIFHFRFWYFGDWVDVVVDDRLPNARNQLIFVRSCEENEFWCALLEKAYAKLYGSYGDLHMGQIAEAMVDFSGGIKLEILLKSPPPDLWKMLRTAISLGSFVGCSTSSCSREHSPGLLDPSSGSVTTPPPHQKSRESPWLLGCRKAAGGPGLGNGIPERRGAKDGQWTGDDHAYSVTGAEEVEYHNQLEELVRVRNPWGNDVEWNRAWSDGSALWNRIDPKIRDRSAAREDGEFWMAMRDFKEHFSRLVICSLTPDFLKGIGHQEWALSTHRGTWLRGYSAGGPLDSNNGSYCSNPQYRLTLTESNVDPETRRCHFVLSLMQKPRNQHRNVSPKLAIACHVFQVPPMGGFANDHQFSEEKVTKRTDEGSAVDAVYTEVQVKEQKLPQMFFSERYLVTRGLTYTAVREVSETYRLGPGTYIIVPSTEQPNEQAEFILRTYFHKGKPHNTQPSLSRQEYSEWEQIFDQYAQVSDTMSPPVTVLGG